MIWEYDWNRPLTAGLCKRARGRDLECESCANTGIDPIPVSEVMSVR